MPDATFALELTAFDLELVHQALMHQMGAETDQQRSIRHSRRCTSYEAEKRFPAFRRSVKAVKRCQELREQLEQLMGRPG